MIKNSLIIPIYGNESGIPHLIDELSSFNKKIDHLEAVFVVDGSPDESFSLLKELLPKSGIKTQLILLSKNFGSLAAVRTGLQKARGQNFAVMAADLQEPLELIDTFFSKLSGGGCDVVYGIRNARSDPIFSKIFSIPSPVFPEHVIASEVSIPITSSICFLDLSTSEAGKSILFNTGIIS